ncbi:mandelate racemase/muconate lactonizing enzyme family protein [Pseudonocardia spinosispora]|uniref:mandelate racemase/muconate lactonizing enzyme family protein n=1 Tax=Pseudonocardia spinosispora TaxID=103441 RepID=UPI0003F4F821|nr:mandelate racemase/muconate lactonizing enzyme family protein [Pseudonocardia spinosispora]
MSTPNPAATADRGRVTHAELRLVDLPLGAARGGSGATRLQLAVVTLTDTDGATGTGYTYSLGPGMAAVGALLEELHLPAVVGTRPDEWDRNWYRMRDATHRLGTGVPLLATSAVDIAMWDLRAVRAGLPLFRLLGAQREQVPVYGSGRATHVMSTEELVEGSRSYVRDGFPAVKLRVGVRTPADDVARVAAVREAVGDEIGIMVDANERLDLATARWMAPRLADLGISWFEEPVPSRYIEAHRVLAGGQAPPLAVGEHILGLAGFTDFTDSAPVWMPDVPLTGGVSEFRRIDALAEAHGASVTPHFLPELHVHLVAAGTVTTWLEHFPLLDDLLVETLTITDGVAAPPDRPGHGLLWDEDRVAAHTVRTARIGT